MPSLELVEGDHQAPRSWPLTRDEFVIGRHTDCDAVLGHSLVSRTHARVRGRDGGFWIEDLGSRNGTAVNGAVVRAPARLRDGDLIRIHDFVLRFRDGAAGEAGPAAAREPAPPPELPTAVVASLSVRHGVAARSEVNAQQKLEAVLEIARSSAGSLDVGELLPRVLRSLLQIFPQARRGCVLLTDDPEGPLVPQAIIGRNRGDVTPRTSMLSRTVVRRVLRESEAVLSYDVARDSRFALSQSVADLGVGSIVCVPLVGPSQQPLGVIQLDARAGDREFNERDLEVLASLASLPAQMVEHARLHERQIEADRRERDVALAADVQRHFLPTRRPDTPGYEFFDFYRAAQGIGGDYFDYIPLPDGRLAVTLGDVSGKGISAALLMARLSSDARYAVATSGSAADALRTLNRHLDAHGLVGRFITFVLCVVDPRRHEIEIANAGQIPPVVRRADGAAEPLDTRASGPPLGVEPSWEYPQVRLRLHPGDAVVLMTDGIMEATNAADEQYGLARASAAVAAAPAGAELVARALLADLERFRGEEPPRDDSCLVCFGRASR